MTEQTDRELLEMAAKAYGIGPVLCYESARNCLRIGDRESYFLWRPLNDAGDALRLAAAINQLDILPLIGKMVADGADAGTTGVAAICRAITYAAAQIGKAMP